LDHRSLYLSQIQLITRFYSSVIGLYINYFFQLIEVKILRLSFGKEGKVSWWDGSACDVRQSVIPSIFP